MITDYSKLRVLIIDDQAIARQWVRGVLGSQGIENVVDASGGREALLAVTGRGARFDLILCDLRMPGTDGIETLRKLASLGLQCAVAILSVEDERVIESAGLLASLRGLNLVGAVSKPLNEEKLQLILKRTTEAIQPKRSVKLDIDADDLAGAFGRNEVEMTYQPKIHMFSGECIGTEALVHWLHPRHGPVGADQMVAMAEQAPDLVTQFTTFTMNEALAACSRWHADGRDIGVSINLSPLAFNHLELPDVIEAAALERNVLPVNVTIEVRETTLSGYPATMVDIASRLRIKGFRLALDGFTGRHSSVEEILEIPFNEIKFDRAHIDGCWESPQKRAVIEAGLAIGRNLKLATVAVGINNRADWELLTELGCDVAQGHFIARPMPESGLGVWLTQWLMHKQR